MVLGAGPASEGKGTGRQPGAELRGEQHTKSCHSGHPSSCWVFNDPHNALSGCVPVFHVTVSFISLVKLGAVLASALG